MGVLDKCCGNCKHFKDEDAEGDGSCEKMIEPTYCNFKCLLHEFKNNGWTEITPDNVDEIDVIDPWRVIIATINEGIVFASVRTDSDITLKACSEIGGYYYYVLPKLMKEE